MKRKFLTLAIVSALSAACIFGAMACNKDDGGDESGVPDVGDSIQVADEAAWNAAFNAPTNCTMSMSQTMSYSVGDVSYTSSTTGTIPRITSETSDEEELSIPDKIAAHIPYFVKGDLFRDDEPNEANEARNWFEAAMEQIIATKQSYSDKVFDKYSQTEI